MKTNSASNSYTLKSYTSSFSVKLCELLFSKTCFNFFGFHFQSWTWIFWNGVRMNQKRRQQRPRRTHKTKLKSAQSLWTESKLYCWGRQLWERQASSRLKLSLLRNWVHVHSLKEFLCFCLISLAQFSWLEHYFIALILSFFLEVIYAHFLTLFAICNNVF